MSDTENEIEVGSVEEMIENIAPGMSVAEYEQIRQNALEEAKNTKHEWRMKGRGKLCCLSCSFPHTSYIPMNKVLVGIDENGLPLLKTLQ